jgi:hypothetical protein
MLGMTDNAFITLNSGGCRVSTFSLRCQLRPSDSVQTVLLPSWVDSHLPLLQTT